MAKPVALAAGAVGAAAAAFAGWCHWHYNHFVRGYLDSQQSTFYDSSAIHVITALVPEGGLPVPLDHSDSEAMVPRVEDLHAAIVKAGGKRIYTGRVISPGSQSSQIPTDVRLGVRLVLVTQWSAEADFQAFREAAIRSEGSGWLEGSFSVGFKRNQWANLYLPMWMGSVRARTALGLRPRYDVGAANAGDKEFMEKTVQQDSKYGKQHYRSFEQSQHGLRAMRGFTAEQGAQPVIIWNWTLQVRGQSQRQSQRQSRQSDSNYGNTMMEMLAQSGAGLMDVGAAFQLQGEPEYKFSNIAAVHYPDRAFIADLMASRWMIKTIQGKSPGDQQVRRHLALSPSQPTRRIPRPRGRSLRSPP